MPSAHEFQAPARPCAKSLPAGLLAVCLAGAAAIAVLASLGFHAAQVEPLTAGVAPAVAVPTVGLDARGEPDTSVPDARAVFTGQDYAVQEPVPTF